MPKHPDFNRVGPVKISVLLDSETNQLLNLEVYKINMLENGGRMITTKQEIINNIIREYYRLRKNELLIEVNNKLPKNE